MIILKIIGMIWLAEAGWFATTILVPLLAEHLAQRRWIRAHPDLPLTWRRSPII